MGLVTFADRVAKTQFVLQFPMKATVWEPVDLVFGMPYLDNSGGFFGQVQN
jgi:hypothetical protein